MTYKFRENRPERTYKGPQLSPYGKYKPHLKKDFNNRCGYTDCPDFWFGGGSTFHIDHFAPKSKFPQYEEDYSNMVYSCAYVNRAKSNDWMSTERKISSVNGKGYLDPCDEDFNDYFERDTKGNIIVKGNSQVAQYMHKKLKLYLKRYSVIWTLDCIYERIKLLAEKVKQLEAGNRKNNALKVLGELTVEFVDYLKYLEVERK